MVACKKITCFKAYDIRGKLGDELNADVAYRIGYAFAKHLDAKCVAVGGDIRESSETLKLALAHGLIDAGAEVIDIGMVGTEEIYFAAFYLDVDGGIEVTASHNPLDYNGMKLVGRDAKPISGDSGLHEIRDLAETITSPYVANVNISDTERENIKADVSNAEAVANQQIPVTKLGGRYQRESILEPYIGHLLTFLDLKKIKPLRLLVNAGNGAAGHVIDAIETRFVETGVPVSFIKMHHEPDGLFPNGIPNPLLRENQAVTADAVVSNRADMGIAWDGDFDRCFLFDENGRFIEGYYIVGLLAEAFLGKWPGQKIIHDPRLTWNTIDQVNLAHGEPIQSKTGHAFIKERMRLENAIYGGEMSAHHYFRDFAYCDSGMIPWLLVAELISDSGRSLSQLVNERMEKFPCSGEINYKVDNVPNTLDKIISFYTQCGDASNEISTLPVIDRTDGISLSFETWRFNLRASNTEPLLRLNIESRGDRNLVWDKVAEIEELINRQ